MLMTTASANSLSNRIARHKQSLATASQLSVSDNQAAKANQLPTDPANQLLEQQSRPCSCRSGSCPSAHSLALSVPLRSAPPLIRLKKLLNFPNQLFRAVAVTINTCIPPSCIHHTTWRQKMTQTNKQSNTNKTTPTAAVGLSSRAIK